LLAALAPSLPFAMTRGRIVTGGQPRAGDGTRHMTAVPPRAGAQAGPGSPADLLHGGPRHAGVGGGNGGRAGGEPLGLADAVGPQAGPGNPAFLLYAGTGAPGVVEINAVRHGGDPILVADTFGPLATGRWHRGERGVTAVLSPLKPRIEWRAVERRLEARGG